MTPGHPDPAPDPADILQERLDDLAARFRALAPAGAEWSLRLVADEDEVLRVRRDVAEPPLRASDLGAWVEMRVAGGQAWSATSDLSQAGLRRAARAALELARETAGHALAGALPPLATGQGHYRSPVARPWHELPLAERLALVQDACGALAGPAEVVDREAGLAFRRRAVLAVSAAGAEHRQSLSLLRPLLAVTASGGGQSQRRTGGGADRPRQGGLELLEQVGFAADAPRLAAEAAALVHAPECPAGTMDLVLAPSQMALQIHESIGHPLELDRILGDERNYAGRSFVSPDLFGHFRYGSELLDVTFAPDMAGEIASCPWDDEGTPATRAHVIRGGVLLRPLGGRMSGLRSGLDGVAAARACDWRRPPIDRMANLNLEPRAGLLEDLLSRVERGVYMHTNRSWSIDDSRNKFQFGCEVGYRIEDGTLRGLVRNPGYRGETTAFWRSLAAVGGPEAVAMHGVANCGKGEPNQMVMVGHAAPPCLFRGVEVFGGGR